MRRLRIPGRGLALATATALVVGLATPVAAQPAPPEPAVAAPPASQPTVDKRARARLDALGRKLDQQRKAAAAERAALKGEVESLQQQLEEVEVRNAEATQQLETEREKLQIYGWLSAGYAHVLNIDDSSNLHHYFGPGGFGVSDINLIFDARPAEQWRGMVEARLVYAPDGEITSYGLAGTPFERTDTSLIDAGGSTLVQYKWGGLAIERAWLEWGPRDWLRLRAGQFITPYGIWNLDHGTPALISIMPPLLTGMQMFPPYQTGLQLHGTLLFGAERLGYHLTVSNGRVKVSNVDLDDSRAIGGRLSFTTSRVGELRLGLSLYHGRYTRDALNIDATVAVEPPLLPRLQQEILEQYDETAFGADAQYDYEGLGLRVELAHQTVKYVDGKRPVAPTQQIAAFALGQSSTPLADHAAFGLYGMAFYQLPWIDLRPFFRVDWVSVNDNVAWDNAINFSVGLNYRPIPAVVFKAELWVLHFPNDREFTVNEVAQRKINRDLRFITFQAALSF